MLKYCAALSLFLLTTQAQAGVWWSSWVKIENITSSTQAGDNNIYINTNEKDVVCKTPGDIDYGDYKIVRDGNKDYNTHFSLLLAALASGKEVRLLYSQETSQTYCTIEMVQIKAS